ncbi:hypothetical protein BP6252_07531 [Coleophoma cylindrospora]|uniref:CBM1 domain-containing protein n=1 Tax=Coleophoma cylindrospora TaxID=1849047 RepID=A0A3D8RAM7_9HELO|nr:hypothetical protein BP6252_07531 [Coleophoma cylindrospora]
MKIIYTVLALATVAFAMPANPVTESPATEKRALPAGCKDIYWNADGTAGGWGCASSINGDCTSYFWKADPPYWSCIA